MEGEDIVFKWIDYEQNSALFIDGIRTNVAMLRHKDFQLSDNATGQKIKMKSNCLDEAKIDAENFLKEYWNNVKRDLEKNLAALEKSNRDCLSCANSMSEPCKNGDILHCIEQGGKIVEDNGYCDKWN